MSTDFAFAENVTSISSPSTVWSVAILAVSKSLNIFPILENPPENVGLS
jgi:hypothetical protein